MFRKIQGHWKILLDSAGEIFGGRKRESSKEKGRKRQDKERKRKNMELKKGGI